MTAKECVERLDWSSAIAAATLELDGKSSQVVKNEESYLYRGIAHCFIPDKEGKHKEALDDLSRAITLKSNNDTAYYYRAYAYYLDGDYERAIADCNCISTNNPYPYKDELLGKIYYSMGKYEEAVNKFDVVLKYCFSQTPPISNPGLLDSYREACKRMNSV
jgi:tetratricopeptide (TPR) repeat protein